MTTTISNLHKSGSNGPGYSNFAWNLPTNLSYFPASWTLTRQSDQSVVLAGGFLNPTDTTLFNIHTPSGVPLILTIYTGGGPYPVGTALAFTPPSGKGFSSYPLLASGVISVSSVSVAGSEFNLTTTLTGSEGPYTLKIYALPNGIQNQFPDVSGISSGVPQILYYILSEPQVNGTLMYYKLFAYNSSGLLVDVYDGSVVGGAGPLPSEVQAVNSDHAGTSAVVNWTPGTNGVYFRIVAGGAGTTPPGLPTGAQTASQYVWTGSLANSTSYSGLIQSSMDGANWTTGVAFSFTTSAPTLLSAIQTAATTTTATIEIHPISATTTITAPVGISVSPSGAQPATITTFTLSGLSPGGTTTATITPSAGAPITQVVLATPPAPTGLSASYENSGVLLNWTTPSPAIAGNPYLVITTSPPTQTFYPTYAQPYTLTGIPAGFNYTFNVGFGQEDAGGTEGAKASVAMREGVITSVQSNRVEFTEFNLTGPLTLNIKSADGITLITSFNNITSPFTIPATAPLVKGTSYNAYILDSSGYVGPYFLFTYNPVQPGIAFMLTP